VEKEKWIPFFPKIDDVVEAFSVCTRKLGYKQVPLGKKAGVSQAVVSRLVGKTKKPLNNMKYSEISRLGEIFFREMCLRQDIDCRVPIWLVLNKKGEIRVLCPNSDQLEKTEYKDNERGRKGVKR
jgi:hypothetical protein